MLVLSATLTQQQRKSLNASITRENRHPCRLTVDDGTILPIRTPKESTVHVICTSNIGETKNDVLAKVRSGARVLWVCNTVKEAQDLYQQFQPSLPKEKLGLLHSRFCLQDRTANERLWLKNFGKTDAVEGALLIGTQVVEQSLDIDADFLVTQLCPLDMLFQRIGRLWRHERPKRAVSNCQVTVLVPENLSNVLDAPSQSHEQNATKYFGASAYVYAPYLLSRTFDWLRHKDKVSIPADIPVGLEEVYCERSESGSTLLQAWKQELEAHQKKLSGLAITQQIGFQGRTGSDDEMLAKTRYSTREELTLIIGNYTDTKDALNRSVRCPKHWLQEDVWRSSNGCQDPIMLTDNGTQLCFNGQPTSISYNKLTGLYKYSPVKA